jgi:hypothetical protein
VAWSRFKVIGLSCCGKLCAKLDLTVFNLRAMKYTQSTIDKLEKILDEGNYVLRYERGSFQSGYCILEEKKVVVLNKFLQLEGRINTLLDLIPQLNIDVEALTPDTRKFYFDVMEHQAQG